MNSESPTVCGLCGSEAYTPERFSEDGAAPVITIGFPSDR